MKVAILTDRPDPAARQDELDAQVQAEAIAAALRSAGHETRNLSFDLDLRRVARELGAVGAEVVVNLVESVEGQGRLIHLAPALLDSLDLPYTGAGTEAMFLTSHKPLAKGVLASEGLPTPAWWDAKSLDDASGFAPGRYIIKSVWEEASLGLDDASIVDAGDPATLRAALDSRREALGGECFAEAYVAGREFNLALLDTPEGCEVLPPAEMLFIDYPADKPQIVGYAAKWDAGSFEYCHTERRLEVMPGDESLHRELVGIAARCWHLFGLAGYARVDFRVDAGGDPWILEVNANPCLSPDAGFVAAAKKAGLRFPEIVARVLAAARSRHPVTRRMSRVPHPPRPR